MTRAKTGTAVSIEQPFYLFTNVGAMTPKQRSLKDEPYKKRIKGDGADRGTG